MIINFILNEIHFVNRQGGGKHVLDINELIKWNSFTPIHERRNVVVIKAAMDMNIYSLFEEIINHLGPPKCK